MDLTNLKSFLSFGLLAALLLWETVAPFQALPKGRARLAHGVRNVLLGVANALVTAVAFTGLWWLAAEASFRQQIGLLHWVEWHPAAEGILALLLLDLWTYAWHRLNHRVPFLWRFHRMHHSDPQMDVTTANRFHLGEIMLSSLLRIPLILFLGIRLEQLALYEALMFAVVQFHHANVSIGPKWDRVLNWIIVTPFMHKVHHSRWRPETDSNYSSLLSAWDRLFGSFRVRENPHALRFGLDEFDRPEDHTLRGLLATPLKQVPRATGDPPRDPALNQ